VAISKASLAVRSCSARKVCSSNMFTPRQDFEAAQAQLSSESEERRARAPRRTPTLHGRAAPFRSSVRYRKHHGSRRQNGNVCSTGRGCFGSRIRITSRSSFRYHGGRGSHHRGDPGMITSGSHNSIAASGSIRHWWLSMSRHAPRQSCWQMALVSRVMRARMATRGTLAPGEFVQGPHHSTAQRLRQDL